MRFKTVADYDAEIKMYDRMLDIFKKCVEESLKKGVTPDYKLLRYIHKLEKERDDLEFYKATQEAFINMVKITLKDKHHYFRKYVRGCTCCESCEDICKQHAIWIIDRNGRNCNDNRM